MQSSTKLGSVKCCYDMGATIPIDTSHHPRLIDLGALLMPIGIKHFPLKSLLLKTQLVITN
ncbi:hypothetical protein THF5G08_30338 [Vibrio jasicida]|nr:hypothetical protein THF5G08_30338 [Vibrio jasicida]